MRTSRRQKQKHRRGLAPPWRRRVVGTQAHPAWSGPSFGTTRGDQRMPGGLPPARLLDRILRVDHAGEYGAVRIYDGQLAALGGARRTHRTAALIRDMVWQEQRHLATFERLMSERRARPTLLMPLWNNMGFALGAATALISERAALACTAAVEEVIVDHYARQAAALGRDESELRATLDEFRADEDAHRESALAADAAGSLLYAPLTRAIKAGCRTAIWLSERF